MSAYRMPAVVIATITAMGSLALLALLALLGGCGTAAPAATAVSAPDGPALPSMNAALGTAAGTWAVVDMGGSAAQHDNFWQLLFQPASGGRWVLATPPGTADNGGLVITAAGRGPLITAIRPSQLLTFTPLIETSTSGRTWMALNPLGAALASQPDAIAENPVTGQLTALETGGTIIQVAPASTALTTLVRQSALAGTSAGWQCGLTRLTAVTTTPAGTTLAGGNCTRPGTAGIFTGTLGTWRLAGPSLPASLSGEAIAVLRLTQTPHGTVALLAAGTGSAAVLISAWSAGDDGHWTLSPPLTTHGAALSSASTGPDGTIAVMLAGSHGDTITPGQPQWQQLPSLPDGTAALATSQDGRTDALAVHHSVLTVWQLAPGRTTWVMAQTINVPIQYGSSG
jgi:hypothetical protein